MFSLTLQMVQKVVGRWQPNSAVKSWGQTGWSATLNTQGDYFYSDTLRNYAKTSAAHRCILTILWRSASVYWAQKWGLSMQALLRSLFRRQVFSCISVPQLMFILVSLQLLKLNYSYSSKFVYFFWSILEAHQAWGTHQKVYTRHEVGA